MTKVKWLDDNQQRVWHAWLRATHHIQSYLDTDLRLAGLDLTKYKILATLSEASGQQLRMNELAHVVSQSRPRSTHIVKRLRARGHAGRTSCTDDGWGVLVSLTTEGMSFLTQVTSGYVAVVCRILINIIEPGDLRALSRARDAILAVPDYDEHP